jgi:hypothetical protein
MLQNLTTPTEVLQAREGSFWTACGWIECRNGTRDSKRAKTQQLAGT